ncbi:hypothetical protein [Streptomyces sp. SM12]|uniref:hypothetical protein n=1 Tax=Streptomyces sp. SM12 TaxID=1071602 RepID=UPI000CD57CF4|nr:hypothetical protein [Streptomyces sp. SM12]
MDVFPTWKLYERAGGEPAELTRYPVVARRTDAAHAGAAALTNHANARSVEEALALVRRANERPGGLYGEQGLYRVVEVAEEGPAGAASSTFVDVAGVGEPEGQGALPLSGADPDPGVSTALEALTERACHSYGIALHYAGEGERDGGEATREAMRHAVQAVAPGFAAAAITRLADDPRLGLTSQQRLYLEELAVSLDLEVLETLRGSGPGAGGGTQTTITVPYPKESSR